MSAFLPPLIGGALIGFASVLLVLCNGRILGVSGILGGLLRKAQEPKVWRLAFLLGLLAGGWVVQQAAPQAFAMEVSRSPIALLFAGLLVGFGTRLGQGCTSGHGVCGIGRFSRRSLTATLTFMLFGMIAVFVVNYFFGGRI